MAIVKILGNAEIPESSGLSTLVSQPDTPLPSITRFYPPMNAVDTSSVVGAGKYVNEPPPTDPCARIAYLQGKGVRLSPERAKALATACRDARGIAPTQTARYQTQTGEVTVIDPVSGEEITLDSASGAEIDPTTGLPVLPWYKRPLPMVGLTAGGSIAILAAILLLRK